MLTVVIVHRITTASAHPNYTSESFLTKNKVLEWTSVGIFPFCPSFRASFSCTRASSCYRVIWTQLVFSSLKPFKLDPTVQVDPPIVS